MEGKWAERLALRTLIAASMNALPRQNHLRSWDEVRTEQTNQSTDSTEAAIVLTTPDGRRILVCNDVTCQLMGCTQEKLVGTDIADWHTDPRSRDMLIAHVLERGYVHEAKATLIRPDGQEVTLEVTIAVVSAQDGEALLVVGRPMPNQEWPVETPDAQPKALG